MIAAGLKPAGADVDLAYYRRRLAEEEARAFEAKSPAAKAAHRRLAVLYWEEIERLEISRVCARPALLN